MRRAAAAVCLLGVLAALGAVELEEDPPVVRPPRPGTITATVRPAETIQGVSAVSRVTGETYLPETFDRRTGRVTFKGLPGDATYDLCVRTRDGRRLEGIDLDFVDQRLLRLAARRRRQLGLPPERRRRFTRADANELVRYVHGLKDFMDARRVLYVRGHGRRATVLLELLKTQDFYARRGDEVIWRIELWYFENYFGGWDQVQETARVLERRRIPYGRFKKISLEYFPQLSVHIPADGGTAGVTFRIPDKPHPRRGRVPAGGVKLDSAPYVLGIGASGPAATQPDDDAPAPASRPATRPAEPPV
jgi:hypothetical protein